MMPSEKQSMAPMRPVVWLRNLSVSSFCKVTEGQSRDVWVLHTGHGMALLHYQSWT